MMYCEFAEAVGCRDNEYNHKVFENLEVMYMNTNMTKEEVYEYGRKLVDNRKTERELELEREINEQIGIYKNEVKMLKDNIAYCKEEISKWGRFDYNEFQQYVDELKERINVNKHNIRRYRNKIQELKFILA